MTTLSQSLDRDGLTFGKMLLKLNKEIDRTVDQLMTCSKEKENHYIKKLQALWRRRERWAVRAVKDLHTPEKGFTLITRGGAVTADG